MSFRNISSWCIKHPVPPIVLFVGLMLAGVLAFSRMTVTNNPDIDFPAATVGIALPGAAPSELETQVTQKVESAIRGVTGVDEINSSINEGFSSTFVTFQIGTPIDQAVNDIRDRMSQVRGDLPDGILEPRVSRVDFNDNPIAYVAAETKSLSLEELSWYLDNDVSRQLRSVAGVAAVSRQGGVDREIRVVLRPASLQAQGITAAQVNQALRIQNIDAPGGRAEIAGSEQAVRVLGNAKTAFELSQMQISVSGRAIRLADVADVIDSYSEQRSYAKMEGAQVVSFSIQRAKSESDLEVYEAAWEKLREIEKNNPAVQFVEIGNSVDYTRSQYESSLMALIEGAVLAVFVVFLFLRDFRATAISALAIPLSAIPAFYFMSLMGINLNSLSLLALALVAGVLVDDAIVEIENIVRHMRMGKSAYQASLDAADEIGLAVLATTMAIVAVFLPVALMPGISGQFFKSFGFTVVLAVLMSLLVARMITPLIAAYFLKSHGVQPHASGPWMDRYMKLLRWTLDKSGYDARVEDQPVIQSGKRDYALFVLALIVALVGGLAIGGALGNLLAAAPLPGFLIGIIGFVLKLALIIAIYMGLTPIIGRLRPDTRTWRQQLYQRLRWRWHDNRFKMVLAGLASLVLTVVMIASLPMTFQPEINDDTSRVSIAMAPGSTLAQTEDVTTRAAAIIRENPTVESIYESISVGSASLNIQLKEDRKITSKEFEDQIKGPLAAIADAQVTVRAQSGNSRDLMYFLGSDNPVALQRAAEAIAEEMQGVDMFRAPRVMGEKVRPEITIRPNMALAADLGVSTAALSQTIRIATIGEVDQASAKFSLDGRQVPIKVMLPPSARSDIRALENLPVPTQRGGSVPLKSIAEIGFGSGPGTVQRTNQVRRLAVGVDLAPGVVTSDAWKRIAELESVKNMPQGVSRLQLGEQKWQAELVYYFIIALAAGVLLVFAVLVLLYRRFLAPFVNMGSLILAPLGALIALKIAGQPLSLPVFIGVLMLFGIVSKNSILLIDFAVEMIDHGMDRTKAIIEAGHKRAQPIVMTTVAMVAGMIPISLSLTGDGSWRAPMGITVIGGLILSTILTLVLVPAYFSIALEMEAWISKRFGKLIDNGEPHVPEDEIGDDGMSPVPAE